MLINEQNEPVSEITLFKLPSQQPAVAGANIVVPLETLLETPLQLLLMIKIFGGNFIPLYVCWLHCAHRLTEKILIYEGMVANIIISHLSVPNQKQVSLYSGVHSRL